MKYMGSKARHAKELLPIILANRKQGQWYVEPFVGGAGTNTVKDIKFLYQSTICLMTFLVYGQRK